MRSKKLNKSFSPFWKAISVPFILFYFLVTSQTNQMFESLSLILHARAHHTICRYMFAAGFQYNFIRRTASFLKTEAVNSCSAIPRFSAVSLKLHLVTVGKLCFYFSHALGSVTDSTLACGGV